jgi:hypothetical protein
MLCGTLSTRKAEQWDAGARAERLRAASARSRDPKECCDERA